MSSFSNSVRRVGFYAVGISGPGSGAWTRLESICIGLSQRQGIEVAVRLSNPEQARHLAGLGLSVDDIPSVGKVSRLTRASELQNRFVAEAGLDLLHIEAPPVGRNISVPTLYSLHDLRSFHLPLWELRSTSDWYERIRFRADLKKASITLTLSAATEGDIRRHSSDNNTVRVLPGPVALPPCPLPKKAVGNVGSRPFALALGHLERRKNLEALIRAAASDHWPPGLDLVLAGADHGDGHRLEELARSLRVNTVFTGPIDDNQKWTLLSTASVVAVPSFLEGFGMVAIEAALVGAVVLVSNRSSLPKIFDLPQVVIEAADPDAWAAAVSRVIEDPVWAQGLASQQTLKAAAYHPDIVVDRLIEIYGELELFS